MSSFEESAIEESAVETYCGMCQKILNPPFKYSKICSIENQPTLPVCSACKKFIDKIGEIIVKYDVKWGEMSTTGEKWMKSSGAWEYMQKSEGHIETYSKMPVGENDEESIFKDVMTGRTDPEIFEWEFHEVIKNVMKITYRDDISKVLKAYCARNPNIGYCQGMSYVCMWLLLFLDENSAMWTLSFLIESHLLPDFFIGSRGGNSLNGFYIEATTIAGLLEICVPAMASSCLPPGEFSNFFSLQLLIQLFVNTVDFESCIFLWDRLMEEGSIALIRGVISLVSISHEMVSEGQHPLNILKSLSEKHIKIPLQAEYERVKLEVTNKRVDSLRVQAREYRAKEWQRCERLSIRKLEKCSNFSQEEIIQLRDIFMSLIEQNTDEQIQRRYTVNLPKDLKENFDKNNYVSGITKSQFIQVIASVNPVLQTSAELIFDRFDEDKSGTLDFRELTICISIMCKGDFDDKLKICFDAYDADKSGFLQPDEMELLVESLVKPYKIRGDEDSLNIPEIKNRMRMICEQSGEILCFKDFLAAVKADPELFACFCDHFNTTGGITQMKTNTSKQRRDSKGSNSCRNCLCF